MSKYAQGKYIPKHPEKYVGNHTPSYRSSWELAFFNFCDNHPSITQWASESIRIPYRNPLSGKNTTYVPDIFMVYLDANGVSHAELIEIKPSAQATMEAAKSQRDKLAVALNIAKWTAARAFCANTGLTFRVVSEKDLWAGGKK